MISNDKAYALFLGCMIPFRLPFLESSIRAVFKNLNIAVKNIVGASCCPAPGVFKKIDRFTRITIAARNLSLAERMNSNIVTLCNGCLSTLSEADMILKHDKRLVSEVNRVLSVEGLEYEGLVKVHHFIDVLTREVGVEAIKARVKNPLKNLRVAAHYGCHYLSYRKRILDSKTLPTNLEKLIETLGAENVDYDDKWACCGAGEGIRSATPSLASIIGKAKITSMKENNVDCIVDICPFCHLQFEEVNNIAENGLKILYCTQLLGLAMGMPRQLLGLKASI